MQLDTRFVRSKFPALSNDWIYFDNAGGSQVVEPVAARIHEYLLSTPVQLGATYDASRTAAERVAEGTKAMAAYVNAADPAEIVMGSSTSLLFRILSLGLGKTMTPGDEVIVTNCDHEANIGPWVDLAERGIKVRTWRLNPETLTLHTEDLEGLLTDRTRLVAVTHTSNILGTINPIKDWARVTHAHGALICVDGVAYAPHRRVDVQELDVDFYAFSFYKLYGPHYALLYGKHEHLLRFPGWNHFFIGPDQVPYKFQPGSVNYEFAYGMLGLWDYLKDFAHAHGYKDAGRQSQDLAEAVFSAIAAHEETLASKLLEFLAGRPGVRIIGSPSSNRSTRAPTISFVVKGKQSDTITLEVDKERIGIRFGDFYARRLIDDLGLTAQNGVVRVSMVHYNTAEEVDRLIKVFDRVL